MAYSVAKLAKKFKVQDVIESDSVEIIQLVDDVRAQSLRVLVEVGGNPSAHYWVDVLTPDTYTDNWSKTDVTDAVAAYFNA